MFVFFFYNQNKVPDYTRSVCVGKKKSKINTLSWSRAWSGGGATRPLRRDGGVEELHGDPTVGPRPKVWTRGQKCK